MRVFGDEVRDFNVRVVGYRPDVGPFPWGCACQDANITLFRPTSLLIGRRPLSTGEKSLGSQNGTYIAHPPISGLQPISYHSCRITAISDNGDKAACKDDL